MNNTNRGFVLTSMSKKRRTLNIIEPVNKGVFDNSKHKENPNHSMFNFSSLRQTREIVKEAPEVVKEAPQVVKEAPQVVKEAPQVVKKQINKKKELKKLRKLKKK